MTAHRYVLSFLAFVILLGAVAWAADGIGTHFSSVALAAVVGFAFGLPAIFAMEWVNRRAIVAGYFEADRRERSVRYRILVAIMFGALGLYFVWRAGTRDLPDYIMAFVGGVWLSLAIQVPFSRRHLLEDGQTDE